MKFKILLLLSVVLLIGNSLTTAHAAKEIIHDGEYNRPESMEAVDIFMSWQPKKR